MLRCLVRFPPNNDARFMCQFLFIYVCWCPTRFPYHMMFVSFNSNTTGATCAAGTANHCEAHEFTPAFNGVCVSRSSVFCIKFCRSLFVLFLFGHCVVWLTIYSSDCPFCIFKPFYLDFFIEELDDTKRVIRIHLSKKNIQHMGSKEKGQKDKQRSTKHTYQTKDRVTRTSPKMGVNTDASEGWAVPAPLVTPVVLILLQIQ
jgi:hypothetical protein